MRVADRRARSTFWLDDAIVDRFGPWLGRFPQGTAAIAIYTVLARHAGRDAESWPSVALLAQQSGCSESTVQRALRLLEMAELISVVEAVDARTERQTSNTYTLTTPPIELPEISLDPKQWPAVARLRVRVVHQDGRRMVSDQRARTDDENARSGGCHHDTLPGVMVTGGGCNHDTHRARPFKVKDNLVKETRAEKPAQRSLYDELLAKARAMVEADATLAPLGWDVDRAAAHLVKTGKVKR